MKRRKGAKRRQGPAVGHPLLRLRTLCGWSRLECAGYAGVLPPTVQNIERGIAPFTREIALALEAATSCAARSLLAAARAWEEEAPGNERYALLAVGGGPFTREVYEAYVKAPISPGTREAAYEELGDKADLLLHAVGNDGFRFRVLVQRFHQFLNEQRENALLADAELERAAERHGRVVERRDMTVAQADLLPPLRRNAAWAEARVAERFGPEAGVTILHESLPYWGRAGETAWAEETVADFQYGRQERFRVLLPDGRTLVVPGARVVTRGTLTLGAAKPSPPQGAAGSAGGDPG